MAVIRLMQFAICLSCVISSFSFEEYFNKKIEESPLYFAKNDIYRKLDINGKHKKIIEDEKITAQNDYSKVIFNKSEGSFIPGTNNERSQKIVKRSLSNRDDSQFQTMESWGDIHNTLKRSLKSDAELKTKSARFKKANKSYDNQSLFLHPHVFEQNQKQYQNIVPISKSFVDQNRRNENVTIFSFIDQNGNLNFRNNFTTKFLNAISNGSNEELIENITKIASQTLKPEKFAGNRWSSDWFEVSLRNQPSSDAKISNFNRLLGMGNNGSSDIFSNTGSNSNFSLIQILKDMIEEQKGNSHKEIYDFDGETKQTVIGNVINNLNSETYSYSEILNAIFDKIKRTSLDLSQSSQNGLQRPLNVKDPIRETLHEFPATKFALHSQSYIPENELNLRLPHSSSNIWNSHNSFPRSAQNLNEIEDLSLITTTALTPTRFKETFTINLDSVQFSLPLIEASVQIYPSKIALHPESRNKITEANYDQVVNFSITEIKKKFVNQDAPEKIIVTDTLQNPVTTETITETSYQLKEESLSTNVPSYFILSGRKLGQLKFIISEFLAHHILEKYNFPKEEKYKTHDFYVNVHHWAGNLSEILLMNPERIAKSSSVLLKADTEGEISAYILQMTDEIFKKNLKRNIDLRDLDKNFEKHHSQNKEEFYTQSDMNSIREFIKVVFYSNSHLKNAIDQSFEEFVIRSEVKKSQDLNEDRQILSSFYSSSQDKISEKNEIYVSHYILPQEGHYFITSQTNDPLNSVKPVIKNNAIGTASSIATSKDPHKCFNANSDDSLIDKLTVCPDNFEATGDLSKTTVIPTFSSSQPNDYFDTRLLTLQKPLLDIFNAHSDRYTTRIRPVISDVLSYTSKLEYVTKIFYSNNLETSIVVAKTKPKVLVKTTEDTTKKLATDTSAHKSILSLKSAYLNSLVKPFIPSFILNFPKSKTETDFTIDVTRATTDTKFANILSNSLASKTSSTAHNNLNSTPSVVSSVFPHGNVFSLTIKPLSVSHPTQPHNISDILSSFVNKLLLLQLLLLMACKKTFNGSNQTIIKDHNQIESLGLKNALTSSIDSLANSTSNPLSDSNFMSKHNFSDITKNLQINLASLLNKISDSHIIPKLQNEKIPLTALFSKDNFSLAHVKDLLKDKTHQYLHYNVSNNNLVLLLQNAIDVIVNNEKTDDSDSLKKVVNTLDHDINELEEQILVDIDPKPDTFVKSKIISKIPNLETSFATSSGISRTPSLTSISTPDIAEVMSTFLRTEPNEGTFISSPVVQSLLPIGFSNIRLSKSASSFTVNSEIENFMREMMNSVYSMLPNEENILSNRLQSLVPSSLVLEYLPTQSSALIMKNYYFPFNQNTLSAEMVTPSYFDEELERTKMKTSTITVYQNLFDISQPFLTIQKTSTVVQFITSSLPYSNDSILNSDTQSSPSEDSHSSLNLTNELLKLYQGYSTTLDNYLHREIHNKISKQPDQDELQDPFHSVAEVKISAAEENLLDSFDVSTEEVTKSTCDGIGSEIKTNFINPSYPLPDRAKGICKFRLYIRDPHICQVRVDFVKSVMIAPTEGRCVDQIFSVQGTIEAPALNSYCGTNEDQHFYFQLKSNLTLSPTRWIEFSVNTRTNKHFYKFDLLISQIRCVNEEQLYAPRGCLQYHFGSLGIIKSFNFEEKEYFGDVSYHICIKKSLFGCEVTFAAVDGDFGIQKHNSRLVPPNSAGVGIHACARDYLSFEGLNAMNGSQRICGAKFSYVQGDLINRPVVATTKRSFYVIEVKSGNPFSIDKYSRGPGFRLSFYQRTNC